MANDLEITRISSPLNEGRKVSIVGLIRMECETASIGGRFSLPEKRKVGKAKRDVIIKDDRDGRILGYVTRISVRVHLRWIVNWIRSRVNFSRAEYDNDA